MRRAIAALGALLLLAGCGGAPSSSGSPTPSATTSPSSRAPVMAFFLRDGLVAPVRRYTTAEDPSQRLIGAVQSLLAGPTAAERQDGYSSAIPAGTQLRALTVNGSSVSVDLSKEYESGGGSLSVAGRLAQLTYTVTQIDLSVAVSFTVEGTAPIVFTGEGVVVDGPVTRDRYEQLSPPILILSPLPGDSVTSPVRVSGTANVFEAQFSIDLVAGGATTTVPVHATSGTGTRGGFVATLDAGGYRGPVTIIPWDASPKDGSRVESPSVTATVT